MKGSKKSGAEHPLVKVAVVVIAVGALAYFWKLQQDRSNPFYQQDQNFPTFSLVKQVNFAPGQLYHPPSDNRGNSGPQDVAAVLHVKASKPMPGRYLQFVTEYSDKLQIQGDTIPTGKTDFVVVLPRGYREAPQHPVLRLVNYMDPDRSEYAHIDLQPLPPPETISAPVAADPRISAEVTNPHTIRVKLNEQAPPPWTRVVKIKWLANAPLNPQVDPNGDLREFKDGGLDIETPVALQQNSIDLQVLKVRNEPMSVKVELDGLTLISKGKDRWLRLKSEKRADIPGYIEITVPAQTVAISSGRHSSLQGVLAARFKWLQPDQQKNLTLYDPQFEGGRLAISGTQIEATLSTGDRPDDAAAPTSGTRSMDLPPVNVTATIVRKESLPDFEANIPLAVRQGAEDAAPDSNKTSLKPSGQG
jgi:hypothetical protein